jgi:exosortase D (VPLPA-CTERM-specific)
MLQSYGMTAYREGNVIDLGFTRLQVVDACSGLRYFFPLIILGLLMAYFFKGAWWKKALLVLSAIPISIVTNSMRIASVGILYQYLGPAAAEGFFHDFSGWFIFMISMGILVLEQALLRRLPPRAAAPAAGAAGGDPEAAPDRERPGSATCAGVRLLTPQFLIVLLLMGTTAWGAQGVTTRNRTPLARPFSAFPGEIGSWSGKRQQMEQIYLDGLELNDYLLADYRNPAGDLINCYVAFNDYQSKGKSSHSPESCLPGSGWELRNPQLVTLTDRTGRSLRVNRALMVMGEDRRVTYYWFDQRGRILTDMYRIKLYNVLDSITLNRTDGALVRLVTPLRQGEPAAAADARLKEFFREFNPALRSFLPPGARS